MNDEEDYSEDTRLSDLKLVLGAISCVLAVVSHFYPLPFPLSMPLLVFCSLSCVTFVAPGLNINTCAVISY